MHNDYPITDIQSAKKLPVFLVHTLLGNPEDDYGHLLKNWPAERPVYGLQARGLIDPLTMADTLKEIASDYITAIKKIQKQGPYLLAGWSAGGLIIYEMARQLQKIGEQVALCAIDTEFFPLLQGMSNQAYADYLMDLAEQLIYRKLELPAKTEPLPRQALSKNNKLQQIWLWRQHIAEQINQKENLTSEKKHTYEGLLATITAILTASLSYRFKPSVNNITLIAASETQGKYNDNHIGWPTELRIDSVFTLTGDHFSILKKENARQLTEKLAIIFNKQEATFKLASLKRQLKQYYTNEENAFIHRLRGNKASIESSYINLAIVKEEDQRQTEKKGLQQKLERDGMISSYEDIYNVHQKRRIDIPNLFDQYDGGGKQPKRLLILGRAGIGKTVLCQRIAYEWANTNLWQNRFELVFWIKLRRLTKERYPQPFNDNITLLDILKKECLDKSLLKDMVLIQLSNYIEAFSDNVLFILDGYDELKSDTPCKEAIHDLLNHAHARHIILTSRPLHVSEINCDRHLENIGFIDENITDYVQRYFNNNQQKANELSSFFQKNPAIHGLAHIPINLELICMAWQQTSSIDFAHNNHITLTNLYHILASNLWQRLIIKQSGTEEKLSAVNNVSIAHEQKKEKLKECLQAIAFKGVKNNQIIFSLPLVKKVIKKTFKLELEENIAILNDILQPGFLHSSDNDVDPLCKDYYFNHLTFQEYFAAQYWVKSFISKNKQQKAAQAFMTNKYNPRYEIIWWFVAGILEDEKKHLVRFFNLLIEPTYEIGIYSFVMLLRCLSECKMNLPEKFRDGLVNILTTFNGDIFHRGEECIIDQIMNSFEISPNLFQHDQFKFFFEKLLHHGKSSIKERAIRLLKVQPVLTAKETIDYLINYINEFNIFILHDDIFSILMSAYQMTDIDLIFKFLRDDNCKLQALAAKAASHLTNPPKEIISLLVDRALGNSYQVREAVIFTLGELKIITPEVILLLISSTLDLQSDFDKPKDCTEKISEEDKNLLMDVLKALILQFTRLIIVQPISDEKLYEKCLAHFLLVYTSIFSVNNYEQVSDFYGDIRRDAALALAELTNTTPEIKIIIISCLFIMSPLQNISEFQDLDLNTCFSYTISRLCDSAQAVKILLAATQESYPWIEEVSTQALEMLTASGLQYNMGWGGSGSHAPKYDSKGLKSLPKDVINVLVQVMNDPNSDFREIVIDTFGKSHCKDIAVINSLIKATQDENEEIQDIAINALAEQFDITPNMIPIFVNAIRLDKSEKIKGAAIKALSKAHEVNDLALTVLCESLNDPNRNIRSEAIKTLGDLKFINTDLKNKLINIFIKIINEDVDYWCKYCSCDALVKMGTVTSEIIDALFSLIIIKNNYEKHTSKWHEINTSKENAIRALCEIQKLNPKTFHLLMECIKNKENINTYIDTLRFLEDKMPELLTKIIKII